jgi:uncharacterized protein YbaP (TraB family)
MKLSSRLVAAIALGWALFCATARAGDAPALWVVKSPTATVYLFGTIHVMKPGVSWSTPAIDAALTSSRDLWLEVPNSPLHVDPGEMIARVRSYGLDPEHPLSTKISKSDLKKVDAIIRAAGGPGEAAIENLRPWLAGFLVSSLGEKPTSFSSASGIDEALRARMEAAGKPIYGFESIDEQLHFLANLPPDEELIFFHQSLSPGGPDINELASMWRSGDIDRLAAMDAKSNAADPGFTKIILYKRNADWARQLDIRLHGKGTSFVAVGVAHLAGKDSLIEDLKKLGYTVSRIE